MKRRLRTRLVVTPPPSDAVQDRVERRLLQAPIDREWAAPPITRPAGTRGRATFTVAVAVACAAAAALVLALREQRVAQTPPVVALLDSSTIVTGPGQGSRVTLDHVIVEVGADTRAAIRREADGGAVLELAAGSLDCDVSPRRGAAPFRVRAGAVTVTVLGTRFVVWRSEQGVRVDVIRGSVSVAGPATQTLLGAGQTWSSANEAPARVGSECDPGGDPAVRDPAPSAASASSDGSLRRSTTPLMANPTFARAQRLEPSAPDEAAGLYRGLATGRDAWAALALYSLADLESRRGRRAEALDLVRLYERRFPRGPNAEDIAWLRVETLRRAGAHAEARAAASAYLARHATGAYARPARRIIAEGAVDR